MNEIEQQNILFLCSNYKNICISIFDFSEFLKPSLGNFFDPITSRDMLQKGLYGRLFKSNIWVSNDFKQGTVKFCDQDILNLKDFPEKWSPAIPILYADKIDKIMKLKAFL